MKLILEAEGLCRTYENHLIVLKGVDIAVEEGEFITVIGRSGSGKSTLLNIIGCLDSPSSGTVRIGGREVDYNENRSLVNFRRHSLGFVFQQFNLLPLLTASENIEYPLLFTGHTRNERRRRAEELLAIVGLEDRASHFPSRLSGGEQQRVAVARALVNRSPLLLADEPTGNLDSQTSSEVFKLMQEINREHETTFIVVTHEREFSWYSNRTIEIKDGRVVA